MTKRNGLLAFLLLVTLHLSAQKYELGKVTIDELKEKAHPLDTSAVAAILFKKGEVRFEYSENNGFELITKVICKIKIYKKEGYDWANHAERYYIGGNVKESVNFSDAITYNLVDGKIEKTKLKSNGEFDEKINKFWGRRKITMPNVKEGSIIEYKYEIVSSSIGSIDEWRFQTIIPVNYSEFKTFIPEYYVFNVNQKGFIFPKVTTDANQKSVALTNKSTSNFNNGNMSTSFSQSEMKYVETKKVYIAENLPAMKEEDFVNNINNYTSSISHELSMIKYPNEPMKSLSTNWAAVTKTIYDNESFGSELNKTGYFEDDLKAILSGVNSRDEKIAIIYNFVKSRVKWNEYNSYYCDEGVRKAYKDMTGNVAEINLMLTAMLRYAGVDANPVLVSTRSNGVALFPNRTAYNYVISAVEIDNGLVLLDATSKNALPNILPIRDLNWFGRMIRKDGTSAEVDLMPKMISKDVVNLLATIKADGTIEGKIREQYFDYNAYIFRTQFADLTKESQLERIEKKYKGLEIDEYDFTNRTELDKPIVENYSFKHNNSIEIIGDKMYFSPLLFFALTENPFKQETREYPIDFSYPTEDKYMITITIPDGYAVETLPQSVSIPMSDNNGALKYMVTSKDKQIQLSVTMDINSAIIPSDYYGELKAFFAEVVKKQTEKVVLKKV